MPARQRPRSLYCNWCGRANRAEVFPLGTLSRNVLPSDVFYSLHHREPFPRTARACLEADKWVRGCRGEILLPGPGFLRRRPTRWG